MRKNMLKHAAALLIGAGVLAATAAPAAMAAPASQPQSSVGKATTITRMMPKSSSVAGATKSATNAVPATAVSAGLKPGQRLLSGSSLSAGDTTLAMQSDGNLVLYLVANNGQHIQMLWNSGTYGNQGAYALMQTDGNLVIYKQGRTDQAGALWSSWTWGHAGAFVVLVDGDLMLGTADVDQPLWQTNTGFIPTKVNGVYTDDPSDTIGSGQGLVPNTWVESSSTVLIMQGDGNLVLYRKSDGAGIWASWTWAHPGVDAVMATNGVFAVANANQVLWNTGTWNNPGAYAKVQSDGNFVIYQQGRTDQGGALWNTGTWGKA